MRKALIYQDFSHFMKRYDKGNSPLRTSRSGVRVPSGVPKLRKIYLAEFCFAPFQSPGVGAGLSGRAFAAKKHATGVFLLANFRRTRKAVDFFVKLTAFLIFLHTFPLADFDLPHILRTTEQKSRWTAACPPFFYAFLRRSITSASVSDAFAFASLMACE